MQHPISNLVLIAGIGLIAMAIGIALGLLMHGMQ
jgi:hypothetical protein